MLHNFNLFSLPRQFYSQINFLSATEREQREQHSNKSNTETKRAVNSVCAGSQAHTHTQTHILSRRQTQFLMGWVTTAVAVATNRSVFIRTYIKTADSLFFLYHFFLFVRSFVGCLVGCCLLFGICFLEHWNRRATSIFSVILYLFLSLSLSILFHLSDSFLFTV